MLTYRWLGTAGLEFTLENYTLLIDPFFTRPPARALVTQARVRSNAELCARHAPRADAVLVTHSHYDHILDVPVILQQTGARAYGSPNACALLALHGLPAERITCVRVGDRFRLGPFEVEVLPHHHTDIPFARLFNGPLPAHLRGAAAAPQGTAAVANAPGAHIHLPLRLSDYRMDACYSFRIQAAGQALLVGNEPTPADALFIAPYQPPSLLEATLRASAARLVIPIHWDDFTQPLTQPLRPMLLTRAQGLRGRFAVLRRMDLSAFTALARATLPAARVHVPALFEPYPLDGA